MNYLVCSAGRRCELLKDFRHSLPQGSRIIATDCSPHAPALYFADRSYLVPRIDDPHYIDTLLGICKEEKIRALITLIDPEIELLAAHREKFVKAGVEAFVPDLKDARLCFDKYQMYLYLREKGIPTGSTWDSYERYMEDQAAFPVFVKPRTGSGSVGARRVDTAERLFAAMTEDPSLIVQELMIGLDIDADVYVDTVSHRTVAAFTKKKLETRIGGASKTVAFKDERLFSLIEKVVSVFQFRGAIDMDFFQRDGAYYLSEINPRFGGAYLHAYGAGVDFVQMMENNLRCEANQPAFGAYGEGSVMMMYDSAVICSGEEIAALEGKTL